MTVMTTKHPARGQVTISTTQEEETLLIVVDILAEPTVAASTIDSRIPQINTSDMRNTKVKQLICVILRRMMMSCMSFFTQKKDMNDPSYSVKHSDTVSWIVDVRKQSQEIPGWILMLKHSTRVIEC